MSLFKTKTPAYKGQSGTSKVVREPDWIDWVAQLFKTPTPNYLTGPSSHAHKDSPKP